MLEEAKTLLPNANGMITNCGHYIPEAAAEHLLRELSSFLSS
jgi:hypothetical protein